MQWQALIDHLQRVDMLNAATDHRKPRAGTYYLDVTVEGTIIGHLAFKTQPITIPPSPLSDNHAHVMIDADGNLLYEAFVQSFAVEASYRRRGYGRKLQEEAFHKAQALGCYQMRSWSSIDKQANYALKVSLGFAVYPALYPMPGGSLISGVYFVKLCGISATE